MKPFNLIRTGIQEETGWFLPSYGLPCLNNSLKKCAVSANFYSFRKRALWICLSRNFPLKEILIKFRSQGYSNAKSGVLPKNDTAITGRRCLPVDLHFWLVYARCLGHSIWACLTDLRERIAQHRVEGAYISAMWLSALVTVERIWRINGQEETGEFLGNLRLPNALQTYCCKSTGNLVDYKRSNESIEEN